MYKLPKLDYTCKSLGSTNKANTAYATIAALESIVPASQWITRANKKPATKPAIKKTAAKDKE